MALPAFLVCMMPEAGAAGRGDILPHVEGWSLAPRQGDAVCTPENLRNIIGGAADLFLRYGFSDLRIGEYTNPSGIDVRVELYTHNSVENAFGIYSQERNPRSHFIDIGTQGYSGEKVLNCFCGTYYVKISTLHEGPAGDSAMATIGRRVVEHLEQEPRWPGSLALFPDEGKIQDSEAFVPENFLGYSFLHSAYTARYQPGGLLFIIGLDSASQARRLADAYLNAIHIHPDALGGGILDVSDPGQGPIALLLHGRYFCGATGTGDREVLHRRLALLRTRLVDMGRAAGRVDLPGRWRFMAGDDPRYSKPGYDDGLWKTIRVGDYWENQGYERYDGIAWYRVTTKVPSSLHTIASIGEALLICLGKIDDYDSVYFNGTNIGHTELYSATRKYLIPFDIIRWDQENTIAVRVDDVGGYGGMNAGPYYIRAASTPDVVRVRADEKPEEIESSSAAPLSRSIRFELLRPVALSGMLEVRVLNLNTMSVLWDTLRHLSIGRAADTAWSYTLKIPGQGSYRGLYSFVGDSLKDTVRLSALIAHAPIPRPETRLMSTVVSPRIADRAVSVPYEQIRLSGYLEERMQANLTQRLLNIDEAGLLDGYLDRPGGQEYVNEYVGKYLSAASRVWRYTRNAALKTQMDRMVDVLLACQNEDGYLGTYLPEDYWLSWDVWGHKYNLIGLLSYYGATGYRPALEASRKIGDLLCRTFGKGEGKKNLIDSSPYIGLASCSVLDPMVDLYCVTGDRRYLDFCNYIIDAYEQPNGPRVVSTLLSNGKLNSIAEGKAYELLSNILGLVKLYRVQGDGKFLRAAETAWTGVTRARLYITGSTSSHERFQNENVLPADNDALICEGCVTTEWLHLNEELFRITGDARYMDAVEQTVYNHLLAAENPLTGSVSYYTPLQGRRNFRRDIDGNCCLASVPRGIAVIPDVAYTRNADNGLSINIYSAGRAEFTIRTSRGDELPVRCVLETRFPEAGRVRIVVDPETIARFTLALRVPSWCRSFKAHVSGKTYRGRPGRYLPIERRWQKNSVVNVECDMTTRILRGGNSYKDCIAIKRGPQVLAADAGLNPGIKDLGEVHINAETLRRESRGPKLPAPWVGGQTYGLMAKDNQGKPVEITLVPFADAGQEGTDVRVWLKKE